MGLFAADMRGEQVINAGRSKALGYQGGSGAVGSVQNNSFFMGGKA